MPKGGKKKIWLFFFLPQDGAIEMNSAIEQEALVNAFSMFISLIGETRKMESVLNLFMQLYNIS